jgi:hypothetical protein
VTLFHSLGIVAYSGVSAAAPGMVLMNPTSIAYSGTSATLGANGQVTFSAVTSLSLNGCFTADFDNYAIALSGIGSATDNVLMRLRASGSDASGTNYTRQALSATSTTVSAARDTSQDTGYVMLTSTAYPNMTYINIYGPFLAQPTAWAARGASSYLGAYLRDEANTHSLSTSYDGFTLKHQNSPTQTITGTVAVYGIRS